MSRSTRLAAASGLTVGSILLVAAAFVEGAWAEWVYVLVTPAFPVLLIVLATCGGRRPKALLAAGILSLGLLMTLSAVGIRLLESRQAAPWLLGLPVSALLGGLGLVLTPLVLIGWVFAATFDDAPASITEILRRADTNGDPEG